MSTHGIFEKAAAAPKVAVITEEVFRPDDSTEYVSEADKALAAMGYKPVFKRNFSKWASFSFALSISGIYGTLMSTWVYGLRAGGASAILWSWLLGGAGAWALAISIAEIASAYPTSGAMYFALKFVAPEDQVPILGWIVGYLTLIGSIAGIASTEYATAQILLAAISMASDLAYVPTQLHVIGVVTLLTVFHAIINSLPTSWLSKLSKSFSIFHMAILIAVCVCLLVLTKEKHSAQYVFTNFDSTSGWSPAGFAFLFGCLTPSWIMTNADSAVKIAEEAHDPSRVIPAAIVGASSFTYVMGFILNLVLVFCMGDIHSLLETPLDQPVVQLFLNALGRPLALVFTIAGFVIMNFTVISGIQASSRTIFSYARDELIPFSHIWSRISPRSQTPLAAVWILTLLVILVSLIALVSQTAISAIFNICAVASNLSCLVPIVSKLAYGKFRRGPFYLGRWSAVVNVVAIAWNLLMGVIFMLPTELPVTPANMNYASAVFVATLIFSIVFWFLKGRYNYKGPRTET